MAVTEVAVDTEVTVAAVVMAAGLLPVASAGEAGFEEEDAVAEEAKKVRRRERKISKLVGRINCFTVSTSCKTFSACAIEQDSFSYFSSGK